MGTALSINTNTNNGKFGQNQGSFSNVITRDELSNGFIQIPNSILDKLMRVGLTLRELLVILAVIRQTLGWQDRGGGDFISASQISSLTGIDEKKIYRILKKLESKNMIFVKHSKSRVPNYISIIKPEHWNIELRGRQR